MNLLSYPTLMDHLGKFNHLGEPWTLLTPTKSWTGIGHTPSADHGRVVLEGVRQIDNGFWASTVEQIANVKTKIGKLNVPRRLRVAQPSTSTEDNASALPRHAVPLEEEQDEIITIEPTIDTGAQSEEERTSSNGGNDREEEGKDDKSSSSKSSVEVEDEFWPSGRRRRSKKKRKRTYGAWYRNPHEEQHKRNRERFRMFNAAVLSPGAIVTVEQISAGYLVESSNGVTPAPKPMSKVPFADAMEKPVPLKDRLGQIIMAVDVKLPKSVKAAHADRKHGHHWERATQSEWDSWSDHEVVKAVKTNPYRRKVTSRVIYTVKQNSLGQVIRFKCRLVARGFSQIEHLDYDEVYAPVMSLSTAMMLLALSSYDGDLLLSADIRTAYLNGELEHVVYFDPPDGFPPIPNGMSYQFVKSAYGLKQAGQVWNSKLDNEMRKIGYVACEDDPCLYRRLEKTVNGVDIYTHIGVYVDDLLIKVNPTFAQQVIRELRRTFEMTYSGEVTSFLGFNISRDHEQGTITVDQHRYIEDKLAEFGYSAGNRRLLTPADPQINFEVPLTPDDVEHSRKDLDYIKSFQFRQKIGALLYVALRTRPDISNQVRCAARHSINPGIQHCRLVDRIFVYLARTVHFTQTFGGVSKHLKDCYGWNSTKAPDRDSLTIDAFSDAGLGHRYSSTGMMIMLNGSWILAKSKTQTCVSLSSFEAEFIAACQTTQRFIPILRKMDFLGYPRNAGNARLHTDSESAMKFIERPKINYRNGHIDRKYFYVIDQWDAGKFTLKYVNTKVNIADICTKNAGTREFVNISKRLFHEARSIGLNEWNYDAATEFGFTTYSPAAKPEKNMK
jgi:hypothetical protein